MSSNLRNEEPESVEEDVEKTEAAEPLETGDETQSRKPRQLSSWAITAIIIAGIGILGLLWIAAKRAAPKDAETVAVNVKDEKQSDTAAGNDEPTASATQTVKLSPETLEAAKITIESVTQRPAVALLNVTGSVEANPQQTQSVTPLVGGRVEQIFVSIGSRVSAGQPLASLTSTEIADLYGKWRAAETRLDLARRNVERVKRAENRVGVLQAKAKLDEAEATLKRTRRLIELGAGAGKDLISAETNYKTALADYDFQRNISLNKEIQEANAELDTANIETQNLRQSLQVLGINANDKNANLQNVSRVSINAPLAGIVTERLVNPGAGLQAGQAMFTLSNVSSVWITANVPQQQLGSIHTGTPAEIQIGAEKINARVSYIDPQINEDTRTARVRLSVPNPGERLRAGMFAQVGFRTGTNAEGGEELVVRTEAIQRIGDKTVVFVPKEKEPGEFEVREVNTGGEIEGYTRILEGLELGDKVVTRGSFTLKTQLQKGALDDDGN